MNIRQIVHESDTVAGKAFDFVVLFLIAFSVISLTVDTLPDLPEFVSNAFDISEIVISALFTMEYIVRVAASPRKIDYIFSFYGIVDLIAIVPFYVSLGVDLRAVRVFRLFRIIRRAACKTLIDSERRKNTQTSNDVRARQLARF